MNYIKKENCNYNFSKDNEPVLKVNSGETVLFETYDCITNQIQKEEDLSVPIDFTKVNPATGPLYIHGAKPNDTLKVSIKSINLLGNAIATTGNGLGVLGNKLDYLSHTLIKINEDHALFKNIELPLNKMIGVIGVAPKDCSVSCGTPGSHGGNMDCKIISEDSIIYLPVFREGGLLSLGDVHAIMGDGEIGVSGAEIGAEIELKVDVLENTTINNPIVETNDSFYTIASALTLDEAYEIAVEDMFNLLISKCDLNKNDLVMLMSLTCDIEVCQVVDPLKTIRFKIKKEILNKLNISSLL